MSEYVLYCTADQLQALSNVLYDCRDVGALAELFDQINRYFDEDGDLIDVEADSDD